MSDSDRRWTPWIVLLVAQVAVSTGAIFARLAEAPALVVSTWRCGLAALILLPFGLRHVPALRAGLDRRDLVIIFLAGSALALHFATWIASLELTTVASSVLLVNTSPLWVGILSPMLTGDRVGRRAWIGLALAGLGVALVAAGDELAPAAWRGNLLALAGGFAGAVYLMLGRRMSKRLPTSSYLALCYGSAALILMISSIICGHSLFGWDGRTTSYLVLLALVPQLIGHSCANIAMRWLAPIIVSLSLLAEPVFSSLMALWVLAEVPGTRTLLAAPLILLGVFLAATEKRTNTARSAK